MPDNYQSAKNVVFYHHPCIDGSSSAWAANLTLGNDNNKYIGFGHNQQEYIQGDALLKHIDDGAIVYFCDIVPPSEKILDAILKKACLVNIYDHHISAKRRLEKLKKDRCNIVFDMERSGAGLSWDIFNKDKKRPFIIDLVEAMDLYKLDNFATRDEFFTLAAGIDTLELDNFADFCRKFSKLAFSADGGREKILELGTIKRSEYLTKIKQALAKIEYVSIENVKIAFLWEDIHHLSREFWLKFEDFCDLENKTLMACHFENNKELISISLRGDGNIDLSCFAEELAVKYGLNGGGHKKAAAVRFSKEQFEEFAKKWQLPKQN